MNYEDRDDEYQSGRAKKSKAGHLSIKTPQGGRSGGQDFKKPAPEAVVKITSWAKSPASVKRMMDYVARSGGDIEEQLQPEDLAAEIEALVAGDELTPEETEKAKFAGEIVNLYRQHMISTAEIEAERISELKTLGKNPAPAELKQLAERFQSKTEDNREYTKAHVYNMRDAHDVDISTAIQLTNAFDLHDQGKKKNTALAAKLRKEFHGKLPEEKRAYLRALDRKNDKQLRGRIYDALEGLELPLEDMDARRAAIDAKKHPKARENEKIRLKDNLGIEYQGAYEIQMLYDSWAKDMDRKKTGKQAPRHAVHLALSAKAENTPQNVQKVAEAAQDVAQKHFGKKGYEFVVGVHQDGKFPHAHLIVKTKPNGIENTKKLDIRKKDIQALRKSFAKELSARGLAHQATRPKNRDKAKQRPSNWSKTPQGVLKETQQLIKRMEKEEQSLKRKLARQRPSVDALKIRDAQARSLDTQKQKIQALPKDQGKDKHRQEAINQLRTFRRKVEKGVKMSVETQASANSIIDEMDKWEKAITKLDTKRKRQDLSPDQKADMRRELKELGEAGNKLMDRAEAFQKNLKALDMPPEEKKALYKQVRSRSQDMQKIRTRTMGRER